MNRIPKIGETLSEEDLKGKVFDCCVVVDHSPKIRYFSHKNGNLKYANGFELSFKSARVYVDENGKVTEVAKSRESETIIVGFGGWETIGLIDCYDGETQSIGGANGCSYNDFKNAIRKWRNPTEDSWGEMKEQSDKAGFNWWDEE